MKDKGPRDAVIVEALRTPLGRAGKGTLVKVRPDDLGAGVVQELMARTGIDPNEVEDVIIGCAMTEGEQGLNVARNVGILAGLPVGAAASTVNRFCGSSLQAIVTAAHAVAAGAGDVFIAGGIESMSTIPMGGLTPMRAFNPRLLELAQGKPAAFTMPQTGQYVSERYGVTREDQDRFALESHRKAVAAQDAGRFKDEIVAVQVPQEDGSTKLFTADECPRRDTTYEKIASLQPIVAPITGDDQPPTITAANSCPTNDGAAAALVMSRERAKALGFKPYCRVVATAVAGVEPYEMGIGPAPSSRKALARAGLEVADLDLIEINEAFAAQVLAVVRMLGLDPERLNVNGGAIALGHPLGATGARIAATLVHEMRRRGARRALETMCIGGGQGIAAVFEAEA